MNDLPLPLVSVTIPCHQKADTIKRAIDSVKQQTLNNLSCTVILDRCSDGSLEIIKDTIKDDKRFSYCEVDYGNVARVRNHGASNSSGTFLCFLDGDDWIGKRFLEVCVSELSQDPSLGIVYTALKYYKPDGTSGISPWPGEFNYDKQLEKANQIPTCSVIKRECWERLGGQRARYSLGGAGSEDGEFYLRAGAYGWNAKQADVTTRVMEVYRHTQSHYQREPTRDEMIARGSTPEDYDQAMESLFHYSWMSGLVTGDPDYKEVDWLAWHPWVEDDKHPFASLATPKRFSHPVHQFDEPAVSVIIPVGPGHEEHVINALDSLEAQTFRKWEAIVVWDTGDTATDLDISYPYVKWWWTTGELGAGVARNLGAEMSRAPFLFFLDADDWLYPEALQLHVDYWNEHQAIIYADYVGKAFVDDPSQLDPELQKRLYYHEGGIAVIGHQAAEYDCERAQAQPEGKNPFIWCNVTSLVPKAWHDEIGGFDESLESWEDVDYHWRLAKAGHCYKRIPEELMVYNFHQGHRRERGRQEHKNLLYSLAEKHKEIEVMACKGCGGRGRNSRSTTSVFARAATKQPQVQTVSDADFVKVVYSPSGKGQRMLTGAAVFEQPIQGYKNIKRGPRKFSIKYGYRDKGDVLLVHRDDVALHPTIFIPVVEREVVNAPAAIEEKLQSPEPLNVEVAEHAEVVEAVHSRIVDELLEIAKENEPFDLQLLPGVGPALAGALGQAGIAGRDDLLGLGVEGLSAHKGVGLVKAERIIKAVQGLK